MYTLYVIPGSHACRSAMLMLERKRLRYRRVDIPTLLHPVAVKLVGFEASGERRVAAGKRTAPLRSGDKMGTVPALAAGRERVLSNRAIARWLDERHPERPLLPADPARRRPVEEVERWANDTLQMAARRILGAAMIRDPATISRRSADGRLGYLLYRRTVTRRLVIPPLLRHGFAVDHETEREAQAELPVLLNRIDGWIGEGVIGGAKPNVADFMVAPSLALILYRPDVMPHFEGRPALELVDRLLPEPAGADRFPAAHRSGSGA